MSDDLTNAPIGPGISGKQTCPECGYRYHPSVEAHGHPALPAPEPAPPCTRGAHKCQAVCPDAFGVPCSPPEGPEGDRWVEAIVAREEMAIEWVRLVLTVAVTTYNEKPEAERARYLRVVAGSLVRGMTERVGSSIPMRTK